jgi:phosphate transport system substrate-binding protein
MEKNRFLVIAVFAIVLLIFTPFSHCMADQIRLVAGVAPTENLLAKIKTPFEKASNIQLTIIMKGGVGALQTLENGSAELAVMGLAFQDWMNLAKKKGYKIPDMSSYKYRVIGKDLIRVVLHKDNQIKKLSKEQLKEIFTGKCVNWTQVGGKEMEIVIYRSTKMPGPEMIFQKRLMEGAPFTSRFREVPTLLDVRKQVSEMLGATGIIPGSAVDGSIASPEIPDVGRPITAITKGAPSPEIMKLFDFIRVEGPKYL